MKKMLLCAVCLASLAACNNGANKKEEAFTQERDSLMQVISEKDSELNEIMKKYGKSGSVFPANAI